MTKDHLDRKWQKDNQSISEKNLKNTKLLAKGTIILAIATIFLVIVNLKLVKVTEKNYNDTHRLIEKQLKSISQQEPHLNIALEDENDLIMFNWELTQISHDVEGNYWVQKKPLKFIFSNTGRMTTGGIHLSLKSNITFIRSLNVQNLMGESSQFVETDIFYKDCTGELPKECPGNPSKKCKTVNEECKEENVLIGWNKFYLEGTCDFCDNETKIINKTIFFCVYNETLETQEVCMNSSLAK